MRCSATGWPGQGSSEGRRHEPCGAGLAGALQAGQRSPPPLTHPPALTGDGVEPAGVAPGGHARLLALRQQLHAPAVFRVPPPQPLEAGIRAAQLAEVVSRRGWVRAQQAVGVARGCGSWSWQAMGWAGARMLRPRQPRPTHTQQRSPSSAFSAPAGRTASCVPQVPGTSSSGARGASSTLPVGPAGGGAGAGAAGGSPPPPGACQGQMALAHAMVGVR